MVSVVPPATDELPSRGASPRAFFGFFLVSGFCSLVYEVVWLRLAMAQFGVTTPTVSIVLSTFMAGLALGSWGAGVLARRLADRSAVVLVRAYAGAELVIAASGITVPAALALGRELLSSGDSTAAWGSNAYYLASGGWIALVLLPFCTCMGATFPLAIGAIARLAPHAARRSFSYLYVANVLGATLGSVISAFVLIELLGFRGTLSLTALANVILAVAILTLARSRGRATAGPPAEAAPPPAGIRELPVARRILLALFTTGFMSMAMEVVWVRQLTPYLGNVVYAFASILAVYLLATFAGSRLYRAWIRGKDGAMAGAGIPALFVSLTVLGLLPLVAADYRLPAPAAMPGGLLRLALGVIPFCGALGFLMPLLVDRVAAGDPRRVGSAYAVNVVGCIVGPLVAGFALLPAFGERWALLLLAVVALPVGVLLAPVFAGPAAGGRYRAAWPAGAAALLSLPLVLLTVDYERQFPGAVVRRDSTATVVAWGEGMKKHLLVNGVGMTWLTPITKMMAHLPLAMRQPAPTRGLTICFGMGTSFRSVLSWGIRSDAVELVPSVVSLFPFFHGDGPQLLLSPKAHVVVDDGRRFLERSTELYDVIIIDPPPPIEASGSSLLYSRQFYETAKKHLLPGGILQQWIPGGGVSSASTTVTVAFVRAVRQSFPYVRVFGSVEDWGLHVLGSMQPMPRVAASVLSRRLPGAAVDDLLEWGPASSAEQQFNLVLAREIPVESILRAAPTTPPLDDDHPINEYYLLRTYLGSK
jgi:predicted membrane-bound spermidine synthase